MSTEQSSESTQCFTSGLLDLRQDPAVQDLFVEEKGELLSRTISHFLSQWYHLGPNESNSESPALDSTSLPAAEELADPFPDGGYGWVCVLCSFAFHFFAIGSVVPSRLARSETT